MLFSIREDIRSFSIKVPQGRFEDVFQKSPSGEIWGCFPKNSLKEESSGIFSGGFLENISHQKLLRMSLRGDFAKYPFDEKACIPIFYPLGIWRRSNMTSENLRKVLTFQKLHVSQELKKSTNLVFFFICILSTHVSCYIKRFIQGQPMDVSEIRWLSIWCTR